MENYNITEAFKALDEVAEIELKDLEPKKSIFSFNDDEDVEELKTLLDIGDVEEEDPVEMIIDIDAESEEDLKDTYVGDVILQCNVCKSLLYKPEDQLVKDETIEDQEVYNIEEECPHCHKLLGYTLIGKVAPYDAEESEELQAEDEAGEDVEDEEVFKSTELEPAEDVDFEEEEKVEVKESLDEAKNKTDVILLDHFDPDTLTLVKGAKEKDVENYIGDDTYVFEIPSISGGLALISNNDEDAGIQPLKTDLDGFKQATIKEFNKGLKKGDFTQEDAEDYIELYVNGVYTWGHGSTGEEYFNNFMEKLDDSYVDNDSNDQMFIYDFDKDEVIRGVGDIWVCSLDEFINNNYPDSQEKEISNDLTNLPPKAAKLAAELDKRGIEYDIVNGKLRTQKIDLPKVQKIKAELGIVGSLYESLEEDCKESEKEELKEEDKPAATSIDDAQKWVDYDMKRYGKISEKTNDLVKKAGFQIIKDDHGDYEVAAGKYDESLNEETVTEEKKYKNWPVGVELKDKEEIIETNLDINSRQDAFDQLKAKYGDDLVDVTILKNFSELDESCDEACKEECEDCKEACEEAMFDNVKFDKEVFGKYFDENGHLIPELEKEYWKAVEDHRKETKITKDESLEEAKITNPSGQVIKQWADSKGYKVRVNQEEPKIKKDGKEEYIVDASYTIKIDGNYGFDVFFDNDGKLGTELNTSNKVAYDHIEFTDLAGKEPTEDEIIKALEQGKKSYNRVKGNNKIISKLLNKKLNSESLQNHLPKELVDFFIDEDGLYQLDNYLVIFSKEGIEHNELIDTLKGLLPDELKNNIKPVDFDKDGNYLDQGLTSLSNLADKYYKKDNEKDHIKGAIVKINDSLGEDCKEESCEDKEELEECDVKVENIDEELFDKLVNNYIKEVYDNVESYNTTGGSVDHKDSKVVLEGKIKFKSGKEQDTKFIFEEAKLTKKGKLKLKGINETFAKMKKAFTLQGSLKDNALLAESFTYNYKVNSANGVRRIYGTERIPMNEDLKLITDFSEYKPWSGAELTYRKIEDAGMLDTFEQIMEESYPEGLTITELNDILWFDGDNILEMLGLKDDEVEESIKESFEEYKVIDKDGNEVKEGDEIIDFRGDKAIFKEITKVPGGPSSGKIYVQNSEKGWEQEYYPSVFNLKIVKIEDESCKKDEELEDKTDFAMDQKVDKVFNELQDLAVEAKEKGEEYTADKLLDASDLLDDEKITEECKEESCELKEEADLPEEAVKEIHETIDYFFTQDFKDIISEEDWEDFMITLINEPAISEEGIANSFEECSPELRSLLDGDKESLVYDEAKRYLSSKMNELKEGCKEESCEEELKDDHHMRSELADAAGDLLDLSIEARDKGEEKTAKKILDAVDDLDQENLMEDLDIDEQNELDGIVYNHLADAAYEAEVEHELDVHRKDMEKAEAAFNDDFYFGESLQENINSVVINQNQDDEIKLEADDIKEVEVKEEDGKKIIEVEQEEKLEDLDTEPYLSDVEDEIEAEFGKGDIAPVEAPVEMIAPVEDEEAVSDEEASAEIEAEFNKE